MSEETIPVEFVALDKLSGPVKQMLNALLALQGAVDGTKKETDELTEEQKKVAAQYKKATDFVNSQRESLDKAAASQAKWQQKIQTFHAGLEIAKVGIELAGAAYEKLTSAVTSSLAEWDKQTAKTGKTVSSLGSVKDATERFQKAQAKMQQELGKIIEKSGGLQTFFNFFSSSMATLEKYLKDNEDAIAEWIKVLTIDAMNAITSFGELMAESSEWIEAAIISFRLIDEIAGMFFDGLKAQMNVLKLALITPFTVLITIIDEAYKMLAKFIGYLDKDAGEAMLKAGDTFSIFANEMRSEVIDTGNDVIKNIKDITGAVGNMKDEFMSVGTISGGIKTFFQGIVKNSKDASKGLRDSTNTGTVKPRGERDKELPDRIAMLEVELRILAASGETQKRRLIILETYREQLRVEQEAAKIKDKEERQLFKTQGYLTAQLAEKQKLKDLDDAERAKSLTAYEKAKEQGAKAAAQYMVLNSLKVEGLNLEARIASISGDDVKAKQLETQAKMLQLQIELAAIEDPIIRAETEKLRLLEMQTDEREKDNALIQESADRQITLIQQMIAIMSEKFTDSLSLFDEINSASLDASAKRFEEMDKTLEKQLELGLITQEYRDKEAEANELALEREAKKQESLKRTISGMQAAALATAKLKEAHDAYNKAEAEGADTRDAVNAGIAAGAGILSGVTAAFIEDKRKQAAIEALINTAAAAASYAQGNIPAGIAYTAAAVSYGAAAAFSGSGVGGGGASSMGGMAAPSQYSEANKADERRATAEAIASAIEDQRNNQGGVVINVDFGSSTQLGEAPDIARRIAEAINPELDRIRR